MSAGIDIIKSLQYVHGLSTQGVYSFLPVGYSLSGISKELSQLVELNVIQELPMKDGIRYYKLNDALQPEGYIVENCNH